MRARRVFKLKTFGRWARKLVTDEALCAAAREIEQGIFEADLGGGVCKKRVAIAGKGKSGSTRTLVAKKHERAIFFLVGREKSEPGSDFSDKVIDAAKLVAKGLEHASAAQMTEMVDAGTIEEICHD
ncbi:MAG: type II toxin-antitoxin system RelE/ParE family toxin [Gammaproteobacteria bacterium]|nr:type II toxin-antitoxin system RelE/ParE family toxin [Gammaproteobacteria bacterium]MBU1645104.1 type II toxin-antitoxin system RelE/ParE family toxin [Gammaproteobacteria bacterium]MBU1973341.1 type II toxin-antitoxin system RelE/ParE family toxin [Gammaproteobacteria bacterium]